MPKRPKDGMPPMHPGEFLREDFLVPLDMSAAKLASLMGVPPNRITEIVAERRNLTADTALRLSRVVGCSAEFWMNLQKNYELRKAEIEIGKEILKLKPLPHVAAADEDGPIPVAKARTA